MFQVLERMLSQCFHKQAASFTIKWSEACNLCRICALTLDELNERNLQGVPLESCCRNVTLTRHSTKVFVFFPLKKKIRYGKIFNLYLFVEESRRFK